MPLEKMEEFRIFLTEEEKAEATVTKYVHDVTDSVVFLHFSAQKKTALSGSSY